jgi:thioredoxin reductase
MPRISDRRVYTHEVGEFDRGPAVSLQFEGYRLPAFAGESVAVALLANGVRTAARSLKYHRPRGVFCLAGRCFSCLARVDGVPNVRTCRLLCRDGMNVRRENAIPDADFDQLRLFDFAFPKKLNYHEMFTSPRALNQALQRGVTTFSGTGDLPDATAPIPPIAKKSVDVLVIGGGPAGIAAALAARAGGAEVLLIEDGPELGGHLVGWPLPVGDAPDGPAWVKARRAELDRAGVQVLIRSECIGRYREGFWAVHIEGALLLVTCDRTIVATGAYDQPALFDGNDLPGIFSARALLKLVLRHGVQPGEHCTIVGADDTALALAEQLPAFGVQVTALVTEADAVTGDADRAEKVQSRGAPIFTGHRVTRTLGALSMHGVRLEPLGGGKTIDVRGDIVALAVPPTPSWELAAQAGAEATYRPDLHGFAVTADSCGRTRNETLFVTGEMLGHANADAVIKRGRIAGATAALDLHRTDALQAQLDALLEN